MKNLKALLTWGLLLAATHVMGYTITVSPTQIETGQSTNLIINLNNTETNLTAYQMKLFLPTGVTVQKKANGKYDYTANADRHDGAFTFTVKDAADGSVLIAVFSPDKDVITGASGELIRLPIDVASSVTSSLQGSLKEIEFTDVNTQAYNISDVNFTLTIGGTVKEEQTLSLASLPEMTEGDAAYTLPQQTNQGLTLTWTVADATIASINDYQLTPLKAGTTTVTATQAGNSNYLPFTKTFTLTVNERQTQPEIEVTDISQLENAIYIEPLTSRVGTTVDLCVKMKNTLTPVGCSFKLTLPQDLRLQEDEYGDVIYEMGSRAKKMSVTMQDWDDGSYDFALTPSTATAIISGNDDTFITFHVELPDDMEATDYALLLTRCLIQSRTDGMTKDFPLSNVTSRLTVEDYLMGDVNSDGSVTPSDAIMTLYNYFSVEQTGFNAKAADMNSDGSITPADAIEMLYTYFGSGRQNATRRSGEEREPQ